MNSRVGVIVKHLARLKYHSDTAPVASSDGAADPIRTPNELTEESGQFFRSARNYRVMNLRILLSSLGPMPLTFMTSS